MKNEQVVGGVPLVAARSKADPQRRKMLMSLALRGGSRRFSEDGVDYQFGAEVVASALSEGLVTFSDIPETPLYVRMKLTPKGWSQLLRGD